MTTPLTDAIAQNWINTQTHDPDDRASVQSLVKTLFTHARDLETKLAAANERNGQQLAACSCAAMMDIFETHEQNKMVKKDNPFWSPAFEDVMRRTAECIELREKLAASEARVRELEGKLSRMTAWLDKNQNDVFRRGIWDAIQGEMKGGKA